MKSDISFNTLVICVFLVINALMTESKPYKLEPSMKSNVKRFARSLLTQTSPKSAFQQALKVKNNPDVNAVMGKMTSNLMGSIASRALKGDLKAKGVNRNLFGDLGGLLNQGESIINGLLNNNSNSSTASPNDLNGLFSSLGQDLANIINNNKGDTGNGDTNLNQDLGSLLSDLSKQDPNLINQLGSLFGANNNQPKQGAIENAFESVANDIFADVDINTINQLLPALGSLFGNGTNSTIEDGIANILEEALSTGDINSLVDLLNMILNDTQVIQAIIDSLPSTYGEFRLAFITAFVQAVEDYFATSNITAAMIEQEIYNFISNLTNQNQQVLDALNQVLPALIAELQSLNETELIDYIDALFTNPFDTVQINYTSLLSQFIGFIFPNMSSDLNALVVNHLEKYLPELIANLSRANSTEEMLAMLDPVVAYHLVLLFNLGDFAAQNNLPTNSIVDVLYVLLIQEEQKFPLMAELMNANSLEDAWAILDPFVAYELSRLLNLPNTQNSTMDVIYELIIQSITQLPIIGPLLNDTEIIQLIVVFNQTYSATNNFTYAIIESLDYIEQNNQTSIVNRTKDFFAWVWPDLFNEIENDTNERVIAGKALGEAIGGVESFFAQFGITVPTQAPPTTTPRPTTTNPLNNLVSQLANENSKNISDIIGKPPSNLVPANNITFS